MLPRHQILQSVQHETVGPGWNRGTPVIEIGVVGVVENGCRPDMRVQILDDTADSGGYFVLKWWPGSGGLGPDGMFDDWVESRVALEEYFQELGCQIRWDIDK